MFFMKNLMLLKIQPVLEPLYFSDANQICKYNIRSREWEALHSAISQLLGIPIHNKRYKIASISCDEKGTTINQVMSPLKEMPKIVSCLNRSKNSLEQVNLDKV